MEKTQHTIFPCQMALTIIRENEIWTNTLLTNQQTEKTKNKKVLWNENKVLQIEIQIQSTPLGQRPLKNSTYKS